MTTANNRKNASEQKDDSKKKKRRVVDDLKKTYDENVAKKAGSQGKEPFVDAQEQCGAHVEEESGSKVAALDQEESDDIEFLEALFQENPIKNKEEQTEKVESEFEEKATLLYELDKAEESVFEKVAESFKMAEFGLPMSLWVIQSDWTGKYLQDLTRWLIAKDPDFTDKVSIAGQKDNTVAAQEKLGQIVIVEEAEYAKGVAKAALSAGKFVLWLSGYGELPSFAKDHADKILDLPNWKERRLISARYLKEKGLELKCEGGESYEDFINSVPTISKGKIEVWSAEVMRAMDEFKCKGELSKRTQERLRKVASFKLTEIPELVGDDPQKLGSVAGLSASLRQDLTRLAIRLKTDKKGRGVLIHGRPGTGKTMLAKLVTKESGREWVTASYAGWQSCDHLGEHLAAMRASFEEAIEQAPSVMFIDELDSVLSRDAGQSSDKNAGYMTAVINALLEWVQLALEKGVAVIGASNYPEKIDKALTRPGRLGEWIEVKYPNQQGREEIIKQALPKGIDEKKWARVMGKASPAKIKEVAREALLLAKERGEDQVGEQDVARAMRKEVSKIICGRDLEGMRQAVALRLCAIARALILNGNGEVEVMGASLEPGLEDLGRLDVVGEQRRGTGKDSWSRLQVALAPAAASKVLREKAIRESGKAKAGLEFLADLGEQDRRVARLILGDLARAGWQGSEFQEDGESSGDGVKWLSWDKNMGPILEEAWKEAVRSAQKGACELKKASLLLSVRKELSGSELRMVMGLESGDEAKNLLAILGNKALRRD